MKKLLASLGAAGAIAVGGLALSSAPAFAASPVTNGTTHCDLSDPACQMQVGPIITGPAPQGLLPANCPAFLSDPTDNWALNFVSGNAVEHGTTNKNGDWGGLTATGQAQLVDSNGVVQYSGQATEWGGGGQNTPTGVQQSEGGFTAHFHGSGLAGSIDISVTGHNTTNNNGTPTAAKMNVKVTCS